MDYRDRATSLMKKKEEINMNSLKNRNTVKLRSPPSLEISKLSQNNEENSKIYDKKTLIKDQKTHRISMKEFSEIDDKNDDKEEKTDYKNDDNSSCHHNSSLNSPKSLKSVLSITDRKHLDFNIKKMIELIESCCTNPLKQVECIVELFKGVDFILNHENLWPDIFKCDLNDKNSQIRLVFIKNSPEPLKIHFS